MCKQGERGGLGQKQSQGGTRWQGERARVRGSRLNDRTSSMWGAIAGIAAASLALAVLHQTLEATGLSEKPKEQGKLPEPGPGFEKRPGERGLAEPGGGFFPDTPCPALCELEALSGCGLERSADLNSGY